MLPTDVPRGLDLLSCDLADLDARCAQAAEALARRRLHHVACAGDGSILDLIGRDLGALQRWRDQVQECAIHVGIWRAEAAARLVVIAAAEALVRSLLPATSSDVVAEVTARTQLSLCGIGGWVACVGGNAAVPVTGDPCWLGLQTVV